MKDYNEIPESLKLMLEEAVSTDPYGLSPKTLYKNIASSLLFTPADKVSKIMEVSYSVVVMIADENDIGLS